jgi:pilus assembly protein CpaC
MMPREDNMTHSFQPHRSKASLPRCLALAATGIALCLLAQPALAATATGSYLKVSSRALGSTQSVTLEPNKSMIIDLPANASEVIVSQPGIAQAIMRTKTRAILQGMASGTTNMIFLAANGQAISVLDITVGGQSDVGAALEAALARTIPGSHIKVESVQASDASQASHVVLTGTVLSQDDAAKAAAVAAQFAGGDANVANIIQVDGNQQVMLRVTVAEVDRTVAKQLGMNLSVTGGGLITSFVNSPNAGLGNVSGISGGAGQIQASASFGGTTISATLDALARRNALKTLAEPVLTAMSGQPADFLAGGQRALIAQDSNGQPTITYKDYGVKLSFTPTVKSNGVIGLQVSTEVSTPVGETDFNVRSAKTQVEVPEGATLAIGGLLQDDEKHQIQQMPGLGDIPILGALFRSRDYIHDQTELVIMVTPVLAQLGAPDLPTDNYAIAGDAEATFLGHLEKQYGVGQAGMRGGYKGSVGFVLD